MKRLFVLAAKKSCKVLNMSDREEAARYEITVIVTITINPKLISNIDEVSNAIKKDIDTKYIYITTKGFTGLGNKIKKLTKIFEEQSQDFYRKKRVKLKKKLSFREKMPTLQATLFKLSMKIGFLYELVYNNDSAFDFYKQSYTTYKNTRKELLKSYSKWEVKAVGDLLREKVARHYFKLGQGKIVISEFKNHYCLFKSPMDTLETKEVYREYKWRAEQFYRQAELLRECLTPGDVLRKNINTWFARLYFVSTTNKTSGILKCL